MEQSIYEAAGAMPGMIALAHAWHERCLADPVVSHAFSHGFHPDHTQRLAAYWAEALGGPRTYSGVLGEESEVVRMHSGNGEHHDMDVRAIDCFVLALDDAAVPADARLRDSLVDYFTWAIGVMSSHPDSADGVPDGLALGRWSWDGPARA